MIDSSAVFLFHHATKREFRFERFYKDGKKMWQAACQFDVNIHLDPRLEPVERAQIEYRQYIRGGVWTRRGRMPWTSDDNANGNRLFQIPGYHGQSRVARLPTKPVLGTGLSFDWKEDGEIEKNGIERYGYRNSPAVTAQNERDMWAPTQSTGFLYSMRDTPSIHGEWGLGDSLEIWIELYFRGVVVQVELDDDNNPTPIKILKEKSWTYFWPDMKLNQWMDAVAV